MFTEKECEPIADIGFVIDSSGSIGRSNWARMKRFLKAMVSKLDVSPSNTHISAVAYSNNPEVVYQFNDQQRTGDVNSAFDRMRWQRGFTYTDKALLLANDVLFQTANGMRANVAKVTNWFLREEVQHLLKPYVHCRYSLLLPPFHTMKICYSTFQLDLLKRLE